MTSLRTLFGLVGLSIAILLPVAAACGDGADDPATRPTGTPAAQATAFRSPNPQFSVRDSAQFRDALLELAGKTAWDVTKVADGYGAFTEWRRQYPELGIYTPASPADALRVSVYVSPVFSGEPASANNPYVVAFAAMDTTGRCAAGSVVGFPAPSRYGRVELPPGALCTGFAVADAIQGIFRATPTPRP